MTPVAFSAGRRLGGRPSRRAASASSSSGPSATPRPRAPASAARIASTVGGPGAAPQVELVAGAPAGHPKHVPARAAIVVDRTTGRVLWQKGAHRPLPIASLTKLMTALVAADRKPGAAFLVTPAMTGVPGYTL